jgi:hypothetical protein
VLDRTFPYLDTPSAGSDPRGVVLGTLVGNHRITGQLSQGGMGAVYRAEHALLGRPAAVKVLLPQFSHARDVVARFFNEARITSALRHPNIVEIYDFGHLPDGQAFIVMEFVAGETLSQRLARALMGEAELIELARQIAGALSAAHDGGVIHRDLKPDNVMLVADPERPTGWRPKLLDFGIAKLADPGAGASHTTTGAILGTPMFMSPEQCRGAGHIDHRADLYSLGCILYQAACGQPPFVADGPGEVIAAHLFSTPAPIGERVALAPGLAALIMALLAKRPDDRPGSARAVVELLDRLPIGAAAGPAMAPTLAATMAPVRPITGVPQPTTLGGASGQTSIAVEPQPRRRWPIAAAAGLIATGAAVALAIALGGGGEVAANRPASPSATPVGPSRPVEPAPVVAPPVEPAPVVAPPVEPAPVVAPPVEPAPVAPAPVEPAVEPTAPPVATPPRPTKPRSTKPRPTKPTRPRSGPVVDPSDL